MNSIRIHEFPNGCRFVYEKSKNTMPITAINTYIIREHMNVCVLGQYFPSEKIIRGVCEKLVR